MFSSRRKWLIDDDERHSQILTSTHIKDVLEKAAVKRNKNKEKKPECFNSSEISDGIVGDDICDDDELGDIDLSYVPSDEKPEENAVFVGNKEKLSFGIGVSQATYGTMRFVPVKTHPHIIEELLL